MLMHVDAAVEMRTLVDDVYRTESRRVYATLVRLLGDFDLAEDALHDAFSAALEHGSFRPADSKPSMECAGGRDSTNRSPCSRSSSTPT